MNAQLIILQGGEDVRKRTNETLEILSDSELLKGIERGIQDIEAGKITLKVF